MPVPSPTRERKRSWRLVTTARAATLRRPCCCMRALTAGRRPTSRRPTPPATDLPAGPPRPSASIPRRSSACPSGLRAGQAGRAQPRRREGRQARLRALRRRPRPRLQLRAVFGHEDHHVAGRSASWPARARSNPDDQDRALDRESAAGIHDATRGQAGHRAAPPDVDVERPLLQAGRGHRPALLSAPRPVARRPDARSPRCRRVRTSTTSTPIRYWSARRSAPRRASPRTASPRSGSSSRSACRTTTGRASTRRARSRAAGVCGCAPSTWRSSAC